MDKVNCHALIPIAVRLRLGLSSESSTAPITTLLLHLLVTKDSASADDDDTVFCIRLFAQGGLQREWFAAMSNSQPSYAVE